MAATLVNINVPKTSEDFQFAKHRGLMADGTTHLFTDSELRELHNMFSTWSADGLNDAVVLDNFNRFYTIFPDMEMPNDLKTYVFITRPEMNLFRSGRAYKTYKDAALALEEDNANDAMLMNMSVLHPEILTMLTKYYSTDHYFIPYLQGRAESLQLPDYQIRTSELSIPFYNYKYIYPTVTNESITGGTFDISFREDNELRITKMFQFWIHYIDAIMKNKMKPSDSHIRDSTFDFMCSVYEIICDPTTQKVLFYAKYSGCFPTSVPISNLSHNLRSGVESKTSVTFAYSFVEAMKPEIMLDFNKNSPGKGEIIDIYDTDFNMMGDSIVGNPTLEIGANGRSLLLNWRKRIENGPSTSIYGSAANTLRNFAVAKNINGDDNDARARRRRNNQWRATSEVATSPMSANLLYSYLHSNSDGTR